LEGRKGKQMKSTSPDTRKMFRALTVALGADRYTLYNNCIAASTSIHEAVFVSWFLWMWDKKSYWNQKDRVQEMYIVEADFCRFTHLPANGFRTIVSKWERKKIVQTIIKYAPPKKYYRLDEERFTKYVTAMMEDSNSEETKELTPENPRINSEETKELTPKKLGRYIKAETKNSPSERNPKGTVAHTKRVGRRPPKPLDFLGSSKAKVSSQEHNLSILFFNGVHPHLKGKPNRLPKKDPDTGKRDFKAWDKVWHDFLHNPEYDKITHQEVKHAVEWYCNHYGQQYVPKVDSPKTFVERYVDILDAIEREKQDKQRNRQRQEQSGNLPWDYEPQPTDEELEAQEAYRNSFSPEQIQAMQEDEELYNRDPDAWQAKQDAEKEERRKKEERLDREFRREERLREKREAKRK